MKLTSSDKKLILVLVGATVLGGVILGIMSRIGVPTAGIKAETNFGVENFDALTRGVRDKQQVMMV